MNDTDTLSPSAAPDDETAAIDNPAFVSACVSTASDFAAAHGWSLGNSVLTHSEIWGLVWRIDFRLKEQSQDSKIINRLICWGEMNGDEVLGIKIVARLGLKPL